MLRLLLLKSCMLLCLCATANTITVKNVDELNAANKQAKAGDIIVMQNGRWNNVNLLLDCNGTAEKLIVVKAETAAKVLITGNSRLKLGGQYIVIDGLRFVDGYAGDDAIIDFRMSKTRVANNCRVTNCVIYDFNNPKRLDENYWVSFSGKKNRIDHCSFINKKNIGVLMAVTLEDDDSRENFHSIDHNYFGVRLPLASNGGEIIRVGVSQHCQYNSNTQITDNFFEHCDGETEIISIKSGSNVVRNNLFTECQGSVVLRHGDNNTVEGNIFLGNGKEGTGGVRIINAGQWVVNNFFYKCRGEGFRSPLAIMNGVPNSPAFRYVPVTDAVVSNNTFYNCAPISLCEGSDTERSVAPKRVFFERNIFYNDKNGLIYRSYDDIGGILFASNIVSQGVKQYLPKGFRKAPMKLQQTRSTLIPLSGKATESHASDSMQKAGQQRLSARLNSMPGFADTTLLSTIETNAYKDCGARWFKKNVSETIAKQISCKNATELLRAISSNKDSRLNILLTGTDYQFVAPLLVQSNITLTSGSKKEIAFSGSSLNNFLFEIKGGGSLSLKRLNLNLAARQQGIFITTDTSGSSSHTNFSMTNCSIKNLKGTFFEAAKSGVADSIIVNNNFFSNNTGTLFSFSNEADKKGYYNVEQLKISGNIIANHQGQLLTMLRGGNDESTMGPLLVFSDNKISSSHSPEPLVMLNGTQKSFVENNNFTYCNSGQILIQFNDAVRAVHLFRNNTIKSSGTVIKNKFVQSSNNVEQ